MLFFCITKWRPDTHTRSEMQTERTILEGSKQKNKKEENVNSKHVDFLFDNDDDDRFFI